MFTAEIRILDEDALADAMTGMREWLDHQRYEPSTFRYTFSPAGIFLRVDFVIEAQAAKFAEAFHGMLLASTAAVPPASEPQHIGSRAEGAGDQGVAG